MKPTREFVCIWLIVLLVGANLVDTFMARSRYVGKAAIISVGAPKNVTVEYEGRIITIEAWIPENSDFRRGGECRLYEVRGFVGHYGWCVTKEKEER